MAIFKTLNLYNFRNYKHQEIEFNSKINLFIGENGAGKTNLLEALHLLALGKSQRSAKIEDITMHKEDHFVLRTTFKNNNGNSTLTSSVEGGKKRFSLNNKPLNSIASLLGKIPIMSFSPSDIELISGPPEYRRKFMNILLSQTDINYFLLLKDYSKYLRERNAVLKSGSNRNYLSVLTEKLSVIGGNIRFKRGKFITLLSPLSLEYVKQISSNKDELSLKYKYNNSLEQETENLRKEFSYSLEKDLRTTRTSAGPQTDDILSKLNGENIRTTGSRGQIRSSSFALKLSSIDYLKNKSQEEPILLLDDIFSELDECRSEILLNTVQKIGQVFFAMPNNIKQIKDASVFNINSGIINN